MISPPPSLAIGLLLFVGILAQWLAWRLRLPAILPLLLAGFLIGPILGLVNPSEFVGDLFFPEIALAVGLILFEGGLTLRWQQIREMRGVIVRLVTLGSLVTWLGSAVAAHYIVGLDWVLALLFGALIIVTGPTVIGPLLRNVRPNARISNVLKWEGILIDPIGALVAVLVFEFLLLGGHGGALGHTLLLLIRFIVVGTLVGFGGGFFVASLLRYRVLPDYLVNVVTLTMVFTTVSLASALTNESGLLAAVVMGMYLGNSSLPGIRNLLSFKEDLVLLFISLLFVTLAAEVRLELLLLVLNAPVFLLLLVIMLILRPLGVLISTAGSPLTWRERVFIGWIAPRGIVAASVTAVFVFRLTGQGFGQAEVLSPLVFSIILGTVALNSLTARPLAQYLGVAEPDPQGFLILGAHAFARRIGAFLQGEGLTVLLTDTDPANVGAAYAEGLRVYGGSLLSAQSEQEMQLSGIGKLLALSSNDEANALATLRYVRDFGSGSVYGLEPSRTESGAAQVSAAQRGRSLFRRPVTYEELERLFEGNELRKLEITEGFKLDDLSARYGESALALFVLRDDKIRVLTKDSPAPEAGSSLIALVPKAAPQDWRMKERL